MSNARIDELTAHAEMLEALLAARDEEIAELKLRLGKFRSAVKDAIPKLDQAGNYREHLEEQLRIAMEAFEKIVGELEAPELLTMSMYLNKYGLLEATALRRRKHDKDVAEEALAKLGQGPKETV